MHEDFGDLRALEKLIRQLGASRVEVSEEVRMWAREFHKFDAQGSFDPNVIDMERWPDGVYRMREEQSRPSEHTSWTQYYY